MIKNDKSDKPGMTVKKDMRDYSNDPYFVKKAEAATAFLKKNGLPNLLRKRTDHY